MELSECKLQQDELPPLMAVNKPNVVLKPDKESTRMINIRWEIVFCAGKQSFVLLETGDSTAVFYF
jgi:hypothetical protein